MIDTLPSRLDESQKLQFGNAPVVKCSISFVSKGMYICI